MPDIIHLLPDSVANQIAAGEVIQRPASVIKELVENAIDAGAHNIEVLLTDAGKTSIQVIDDGRGMSDTDARLAFERHATSKIRQAADLFALTTMGFRGEALPSIASVAQVELRTRRPEDELGTRIVINGSRIEEQESVACPVGASFTVRNLFFNVPARRKFLKSNQTELNNILTEMDRIMLVHPEVAFTVSHNGNELYRLPATALRARLMNIFGKKLNDHLLAVEVETTLVRISGFVGKPEASRKKGAHQYFFVNSRYMRHPYFHKAVMEAYEHLVPAGEQVPYFVYMEVDPANIDVNIHPTKTEIKFENEQAVWQILAAAVKESLGRFNEVPSIDFDTEGMPDIPALSSDPFPQAPQVKYNPNFNPFEQTPSSSYSRPQTRTDWEPMFSGLEKENRKSTSLPSAIDSEEWDTPSQSGQTDIFGQTPGNFDYGTMKESKLSTQSPHHPSPFTHHPSPFTHHPSPLTAHRSPLTAESTPITQFKGQYLLTSVKSGLMIIDQHRAHTRVLFDRYMAQFEGHRGTSQGLLFPEVLQLTAAEAVMLESIWEELSAVGFELSNLGGGSYSIIGIPAGTEGLNAPDLIHRMVVTAIESGSSVTAEVRSAIALSLARSAAIVAGQILTPGEMEELGSSLFACATPDYTPDGKKVITIIPLTDIERNFR